MNHRFLIVILLALSSCRGKEKSVRTTPADTSQITITESLTPVNKAVADNSGDKNIPSASTEKWMYSKTVDRAGSTVHKAIITSPNVLTFTFPYAGGSTATLTIREKNNDTNVYLDVSKGQFNRSFQGGAARIRFDNTPSAIYSFSAAENGRANIVFFDSPEALIDRMKKARKMVVNVNFYAQGSRQIEFNVANLVWNH